MITRDFIIANGGATVDKCGNAVTLKSGYQVSKRDLGVCEIKEFTQQMVNDIVAYGLHRGEYAGFWVENGRVYADISQRIATKKDALAIGKQRKQISIWQWAKGSAVYC